MPCHHNFTPLRARCYYLRKTLSKFDTHVQLCFAFFANFVCFATLFKINSSLDRLAGTKGAKQIKEIWANCETFFFRGCVLCSIYFEDEKLKNSPMLLGVWRNRAAFHFTFCNVEFFEPEMINRWNISFLATPKASSKCVAGCDIMCTANSII